MSRLLDAISENAKAGLELPSNEEVFPSLETLCSDYVKQMKAKGQRSHDAYYRAPDYRPA
ncbi:hypothetical protein [Hyphococcus sp.]|uniref:hypothetical protein n=1 Tax=Hyphococcus sp. TaxID=2038636 RepID=UPI003D11AB84